MRLRKRFGRFRGWDFGFTSDEGEGYDARQGLFLIIF